MKNNNPLIENKSLRSKKRKKKDFSPFKKDKKASIKLEEYENYLKNIQLMSRGSDLEVQ